MKIAVLGWGSLIWDPRELSIKGKWRKDGPKLPIEFARQSSGERLTLVIHPYEGVRDVNTYWAFSAEQNIEGAIENLIRREGTFRKRIWRSDKTFENPDNITDIIAKWAKENHLYAVIWTALPSSFNKKENFKPSKEEVVRYLNDIVKKGKSCNAETYIRNTPKQIQTSYRPAIEKEFGWTSNDRLIKSALYTGRTGRPYPDYSDYLKHLRRTAACYFKANNLKYNKHRPYELEADGGGRGNWQPNIIEEDVVRYIEGEVARCKAEKKHFPLHKYLHHGLSSKAMLFNLLGLLVTRGLLDKLQDVFGERGITWPEGELTAIFEASDGKVLGEDMGQPTSFDLEIRGASGSLFIESKFTENGFGGCSVFASGDCDGQNPANNHERCYLDSIGRSYWSLMGKYGLCDGDLGAGSVCPFTVHYQFFRELLYALENNGDFILLYDARNPCFIRNGPRSTNGVFSYLCSLLPEEVRRKTNYVSIQDVFNKLKKEKELKVWAEKFSQKYGV